MSEHRLKGGFVAALAVAGLTASPALADVIGVYNTTSVQTPPMVVESNASADRYVTASASGASPHAKVSYSVHAEVDHGKVKTMSFTPSLIYKGPGPDANSQANVEIFFPDKKVDRENPADYSTNWYDTMVFYRDFSQLDLKPIMLAACNSLADSLRAGGMSETEIFGQHRWVYIYPHGKMTYDTSLNGSHSVHYKELSASAKKIPVLCKGKDLGLDAPQMVIGDADLIVAQGSGSAQNKCEVELNGLIASSEPNLNVQYRFEDGSGALSPVYSGKTDGNGIANVTHAFPVPKGKNSGTIRMLGAGSTPFATGYMPYEVNCAQNTQIGDTLTVDLPPVPSITTSVKTSDWVNVPEVGYSCPTTLKVFGHITAKSDKSASGTAHLSQTNFGQNADTLLKSQPFSVAGVGKEAFVVGTVDLTDLIQEMVVGLSSETIKVDLKLTLHNTSGKFAEETKSVSVDCYKQTSISGAIVVAPKPVLQTNLGPLKVYNGWACPAHIGIAARLEGQSANTFTGSYTLTDTKKMLKHENILIAGDDHVFVEGYPLDKVWSQSGPTPQQSPANYKVQAFTFKLIVKNAQNETVREAVENVSATCVPASAVNAAQDPAATVTLKASFGPVKTYNGWSCPSYVALTGQVQSQTPQQTFNGSLVLTDTDDVIEQKGVSLQGSETQAFLEGYPLDELWGKPGPTPQQTKVKLKALTFKAFVKDADSKTVGEAMASVTAQCYPAVVQGIGGVAGPADTGAKAKPTKKQKKIGSRVGD